MNHHPYRGIRSGFSLIELIFTVSILSILSAAGVSSLSHFMNRAQSATATRAIVSALQYTRSEAIGRNKVITLCLSDNGVNCDKTSTRQLIVFRDENNNKASEADELIRIIQFNGDNPIFEFRVSGKNRSTLTHRNMMSWIEAKSSNITKRTNMFAFICRA